MNTMTSNTGTASETKPSRTNSQGHSGVRTPRRAVSI